jgi:hypothetical protein
LDFSFGTVQMDMTVEKGWSFLCNFVVIEELAVAHAHARKEKQPKQWITLILTAYRLKRFSF